MDKDTALRLDSLRQELKRWEKAFAAANHGRKAAREDIKRDATIAATYRDYNDLRRSIAKPAPAETPRKRKQPHPGNQNTRTALRERTANEDASTPRRVSKHTQQSLEPVLEEQEDEQPAETTPAFIRHALGPTPQRDGLVLGIFDVNTSATPSKSALAPLEPVTQIVSGTPSKPSASASYTYDPTLSRTPQSSSRRFFFDVFAGTPLKRKREDGAHTPGTAKRHYATPSFLRRSFPMAKIDEPSEIAVPAFKKAGLVRSLSTIIQGLRKQEDRRMDDDWEIMNDLEQGQGSGEAAEVLIQDSQAVEMPLGPDQAEHESDDDSSAAEDGDLTRQPRKPWKKKGLKRQTKRVMMRPVLHKVQKADVEVAADDSKSTAGVQAQAAHAREATEAGTDYAEPTSDADNGDEAPVSGKGKAKAKANETPASLKPRKKISAQSHANYRALKIKNKNSKAKGKGGRFGRR